MVVPAARMRKSASHMACRTSGSSPAVHSSRINTRGCGSNAKTSDRRCFSPPERVFTICRAFFARPKRRSNSFSSAGQAYSAAKRRHNSRTRMASGYCVSCNCTPTCAYSARRFSRGLRSRKATRPLVGLRSPSRHSTVEVLPAPLGPMMARISPSRRSNDTSRTAYRSP